MDSKRLIYANRVFISRVKKFDLNCGLSFEVVEVLLKSANGKLVNLRGKVRFCENALNLFWVLENVHKLLPEINEFGKDIKPEFKKFILKCFKQHAINFEPFVLFDDLKDFEYYANLKLIYKQISSPQIRKKLLIQNEKAHNQELFDVF